MANKVRITYYGVEGEGPTMTEAKKDAGKKIEQMLDGNYTPHVISWRGNSYLIYREPKSGWHTKLIVCEGNIDDGEIYGTCGYCNRKEAILTAKYGLAQLGWNHEDGQTIPEILGGTGKDREFLRWTEFQVRYKRAKDAGLNDNDCHAYGCEAAFREDWKELIARVEGAKVEAPNATY